MKKYAVVVFVFLVYFQVYSQENDSLQGMNIITPKDYFFSNNISYYFAYDGVKTIQIDNNSLVLKGYSNITDNGSGNISFTDFLSEVTETLYSDDGSVVFYRSNSDYSCKNDAESNCLYAPLYIRKISKKSLIGNIALYRLDKSLPLKTNDTIDFPIGSELYTVSVEMPDFDLNTFSDLSSLVCSKNEDNLCRGVINNGALDMAALFELTSIKEDNKEFLYTDTNNGHIYHFDLPKGRVIPYNKVCVQSSSGIDDLYGCIEKGMKQGSIKQYKHPSGIVYWKVDYNNPALDNVFFWVNNSGEPFKVYTNSKFIHSFSLFNKEAAEAINKLIADN